MVRLFVAEKPSVARDIAKVVGARRRADDHLRGDAAWVGWCVGHLVEIQEPHEQDPRWKRWADDTLPMLPERLKLRPVERTRDLFAKLAALLCDPEVDEVVNACDAGREGELIFRYVYELSGSTKPVRRLWLASMTEDAIRTALRKLRPREELDPLAEAARCRAEADWLVGMNATRGLTLRAGPLLTVGRVQTPTLAMVVARDKEIEGFRPEAYWLVEGAFSFDADRKLVARWTDGKGVRLPNEASAQAIVDKVAGRPAEVGSVAHERQSLPPPPFHHLTSLQQEANRRYGLSAERTLAAAQALYERHKLLTYPRTDSAHLSSDVAATLPNVLAAQLHGPYGAVARRLLAGELPRLTKRHVDDAKVTDHHAIIPTGERASEAALSIDEERIYDLVARRVVAAFLPAAVYAKTRVELIVAGERFLARGRVRLEAGFEEVIPPVAEAMKKKRTAPKGDKAEEGDEAPEDDDPEGELPTLEAAERGTCASAKVLRRETKPPRRFTEATLLGAMERAGRALDDERLRAAMREGGLGTPATRAATIENLLRREYIARDGRALVALPAGRALVDAVPIESLKSPELTGEWEARLADIAAGRADAAAFRTDIRRFVTEVVEALRRAPRIALPEGMAAAPRGDGARDRDRETGGRGGNATDGTRSAGPVRQARARTAAGRKRAAAGASGPRTSRSRAAEPAPRASDSGTPQDAGAPGDEGSAAPRTARKPIPCPLCREGYIIRGNTGWGCKRWREGCRFVVRYDQDGVRVPDDEARRLFRTGKTRLFASPKSLGRKARLVLDLDRTERVRWEAPSRAVKARASAQGPDEDR